jgi:DNA-directed RNA polymerase specialized sigma24 family protein
VSSFVVTAQKSGDWWALTVEGPGLRRPAYTQARRLDKAEAMVRDLLALQFDIDPADVGNIEITPVDQSLADEVADTRKLRREADRLRDEATTRTRSTARHLRERGYAQREIGALLGVSHQAVGKLLGEQRKPSVDA